MRTATKLFIVMAAALGLSNTSGPKELSTAPLGTVSGTAFNCNIVNVSSRTVTIVIRTFYANGTLRAETTPSDLSPGEARIVGFGGETNSFYCKFSVEGAKKSVRAAATVSQSGVGTIAVAPAQ